MAKNKFDILEDDAKDVVAAAALKENKNDDDGKETINLTAVPKKLLNALRDNKKNGTGEAPVTFIKRAAMKLAKEEGIL